MTQACGLGSTQGQADVRRCRCVTNAGATVERGWLRRARDGRGRRAWAWSPLTPMRPSQRMHVCAMHVTACTWSVCARVRGMSPLLRALTVLPLLPRSCADGEDEDGLAPHESRGLLLHSSLRCVPTRVWHDRTEACDPVCWDGICVPTEANDAQPKCPSS